MTIMGQKMYNAELVHQIKPVRLYCLWLTQHASRESGATTVVTQHLSDQLLCMGVKYGHFHRVPHQ
jgi:hypothetical protein